MSGDRYMEADLYSESAYTADISTRMRVPDRLMAHNGGSDMEEWGERERQHTFFNMQVPDRIMVAGGDKHFSSKSTPRELQLEPMFVPPTPEHVRVQTPPRSIKLDEVTFPSAAEEPRPPSPPRHFTQTTRSRGIVKERVVSFDADVSLSERTEANLSLHDEVQMMRRQMAKLNHRLISLELENQQQNQRWQICSALVTAYFLVKTFLWLNRH